ncbi:MAG: hypothetical protein ACRDPG_10815 [Nocardioidaceae bacterium]
MKLSSLFGATVIGVSLSLVALSPATARPALTQARGLSTQPVINRPQFLSASGKGAIDGIAQIGSQIVTSGHGITRVIQGDGTKVAANSLDATAPGNPGRVVWHAAFQHVWWDIQSAGDRHTFFAAGNNGVWKFDLRRPGGRALWYHHVAGAVTTVHLIPHTNFLILGGKFSGGLQVISRSSGRQVAYRVPQTNAKVGRGVVQPGGNNYVFFGAFTQVGKSARSQVAMLRLGLHEAILDPWTAPLAGRSHCSATEPMYVRDVKFAPNGKWFVFGSSGSMNWHMCNAVVRFEMRPNHTRSVPTWIRHTGCGDSVDSLNVLSDSSAILVAGHFRCMTMSNGKIANRYGTALINANGTLSTWKSDKCRGVGGTEISAVRGGYALGYDCRFWGNSENQNPTPSKEFPRVRYAFLPDSAL